MRLLCIANNGAFLPESYLRQNLYYNKETKFLLTVSKEYTVYALYEWQGNVWYYICDDNYMYYPQQNPAPLFQIVDNTLSKYWKFDIAPNGLLTLAFEEWLADPYFYDKLTDMEEKEVLIFERVKTFIDAEVLCT